MRRASRASSGTNAQIVCPICEAGQLRSREGTPIRCSACRQAFDVGVLETLRQIAALPDAAGRHACECGHPEMRLLPDGVFYCPACGAEVLPVGRGGKDG